MGEKKNALVQSIIEIACKNDISQQAKEKAIANLIENHGPVKVELKLVEK